MHIIIHLIIHIFWLVVSTTLKNMNISWDYSSQYIWKVIKFLGSKAPTSIAYVEVSLN